MTYPNFIVIGAMKCGTSTLAAQLGAQDGIFVTDPKEPNYFSDDANFSQGPEAYTELFAEAMPNDICGEASTHYTKRPNFPETIPRMRDALNDVRLIYMIRNPMERLVSHYIHEWSESVISGSLGKALSVHSELVDYGRFGWQIEPYVEAFGRESILLTSLERLKLQRDEELARIAKHIGFTGSVEWEAEKSVQNVSAERIRKLPMHQKLIDSPTATRLRQTLVPASIRARIRATRQIRERPEIPANACQGLETVFKDDQKLLAKYFLDDPSVQLAYPFLT